MNWEKLLSTKRVSEVVNSVNETRQIENLDIRHPFERDYDQIVFSHPFRRLQDKTQVIPLPKYDFVHTRLTHSLEVASVGRSLGRMAAEKIFYELGDEKIKEMKLCKADIGTLVATACLAHDIGNPPFGHSGEDAISSFFRRKNTLFDNSLIDDSSENIFFTYKNNDINDLYILFKNDSISTTLSSINYGQQRCYSEFPFSMEDWQVTSPHNNIGYARKFCDLAKFEGNANGFRILATCYERTGINPTSALLGTFTKYPRESLLTQHPDNFIDLKSQKKYGFFQEQKELFKKVVDELGLIKIDGIGDNDTAYHRHPLAFLMEAADDIAYSIIDFEDGCRQGLIDIDKEYGTISFRNKNNENESVAINKTPRKILLEISDANAIEIPTDDKHAIAYLRGKVINSLIMKVYKVFTDNYDKIMQGTFDEALIDKIDNPVKDNLSLLKSLVRKFVYQSPSVLEREISGFEVVEHLIDSFSKSCNICYSCCENETAKELKLRMRLPEDFQPDREQNEGELTIDEKYTRILKILDYIAGMTDHYAVNLYKRIKGIEI